MCGNDYEPGNPDTAAQQKYCSPLCRKAAAYARKAARLKHEAPRPEEEEEMTRSQRKQRRRELRIPNLKAAVDFLLEEFTDLGLHVYKIAKTGSIYLQFRDDVKRFVGAIRIGDHAPRSHLGYRWQLRVDVEEFYVDPPEGDRKHCLFLYPIGEPEALARDLRVYYDRRLTMQAEREINEHFMKGNDKCN